MIEIYTCFTKCIHHQPNINRFPFHYIKHLCQDIEIHIKIIHSRNHLIFITGIPVRVCLYTETIPYIYLYIYIYIYIYVCLPEWKATALKWGGSIDKQCTWHILFPTLANGLLIRVCNAQSMPLFGNYPTTPQPCSPFVAYNIASATKIKTSTMHRALIAIFYLVQLNNGWEWWNEEGQLLIERNLKDATSMWVHTQSISMYASTFLYVV